MVIYDLEKDLKEYFFIQQTLNESAFTFIRKEEIFIKRFLYYLAWTIVIGLIFYMGMKWRFQIQEKSSSEFRMFPIVLFSVIFPIVLGMLLRLPQLIIEIKQNKKWSFDLPKFIAVGLPTLLILFYYIISGLGIVTAVHLILISGSTLATIAGIVFGYSLLDCLKKE